MSRIWQWLGFHVHTWSKWRLGGTVLRGVDTVAETQVRTCSECGKTEANRVWMV